MIGSCQTNSERQQITQPYKAKYNAVNQMGGYSLRAEVQTSPEGLTVVHVRISMCNMATKLETAGVHKAGECWLVSTLADIFIGNLDPPGNS